jgi:formate-dependent nitrite reductase cytochrome c552 subunit
MGVDAAVLNEARSKHSEAHIHWEWWSAANGGHFHNPQQFEESINKGMTISQAGIKLLDDAIAKRRAEGPVKAAGTAPVAPAAPVSSSTVVPPAAGAK